MWKIYYGYIIMVLWSLNIMLILGQPSRWIFNVLFVSGFVVASISAINMIRRGRELIKRSDRSEYETTISEKKDSASKWNAVIFLSLLVSIGLVFWRMMASAGG